MSIEDNNQINSEITYEYDEFDAPDERECPPDFHARTQDDIRRLIEEAGLGYCWEALRPTVKNDILLIPFQTEEAAIAIGTSKMGGIPDLPPGWNWPSSDAGIPLAFVAQINCKDVAPYDRDSLLPGEGMLYFFAAGDGEWVDQGECGYNKNDRDRFKVLYFDGDLKAILRVPLPGCEKLDEYRRNSFEMAESREITLPDEWLTSYQMTGLYPTCSLEFASSSMPVTFWESPLFKEVFSKSNDEENDRDYRRYLKTLLFNGPYIPNKLLGNPDCPEQEIEGFCVQACGLDYSDPQASEVLNHKDDWILLFQVPSSFATRMNWGDAGVLFYIIRKQDLVERRFDKIWAMMQFN